MRLLSLSESYLVDGNDPCVLGTYLKMAATHLYGVKCSLNCSFTWVNYAVSPIYLVYAAFARLEMGSGKHNPAKWNYSELLRLYARRVLNRFPVRYHAKSSDRDATPAAF
ncbi:MAG: hypothetical protein DHS20C01_07100 [marine bacterium B5-7]|nr:MAG: hypothetical protein DHS20C01_07100 [marine bacterium B5-7]